MRASGEGWGVSMGIQNWQDLSDALGSCVTVKQQKIFDLWVMRFKSEECFANIRSTLYGYCYAEFAMFGDHSMLITNQSENVNVMPKPFERSVLSLQSMTKFLSMFAMVMLSALIDTRNVYGQNWNKTDEIIIYKGLQTDNWGIPWNKTPNYPTAKYYLTARYLYDYLGFGGMFFFPASDPRELTGYQTSSKVIKKEMQESSLLSYLLYDDGQIVVDEITPRFDGLISDETLLYSHSFGKSLTSYLLGHAICRGYISDLDQKLDDWDLIKDTLYEDQSLIDLVNMSAGDYQYVTEKSGFLESGRWFNEFPIRSFAENELKGTKASPKKYNYHGLLPNLVFSYIAHKTGDEFYPFIDRVFQEHIRTQSNIIQATNHTKLSYGNMRATFVATRYDFLRLGIAILEDWESDNCVGKYLKDIYSRKVDKERGTPDGKKWSDDYWKSYGGFFHTDLRGFEGRRIMGMDGYGGQVMWIDFDNSRIIYVHTVHGDYDHKDILLKVIKGDKDLDDLLDISYDSKEVKSLSKGRLSKFDRSKIGLEERFKCFVDNGRSKGLPHLPSPSEVSMTINNSQKNLRTFTPMWEIDMKKAVPERPISHLRLENYGLSEKTVDTYKDELVKLVNYEGSSIEYCKEVSQ